MKKENKQSMNMLDDFDPLAWDGSVIVLYGIGHDCQYIERGLKLNGIEYFIYCDRSASHSGDAFHGKDLIHPDDLSEHKEAHVIICTGKYFHEAKKRIEQAGCEKIYTGIYLSRIGTNGFISSDGKESPYSYRQAVYRHSAIVNNYWILNHLDLFITECCTLNCFGCANLIPYYQQPRHHSWDYIEDGINGLLSSKCYIADLCLIGGEPLLNEDVLCHALNFYNKEDQIGMISMITNGTILPSNKVLSAMSKSDKFCAIVSNYGEVSSQLNLLKEKLSEWHVPMILLEEENYPWWSEGELRKYERSWEKTQEMFNECEEKGFCTTLMRDKLYICERIANGENLGIIPISEKNSVHLKSKEFMQLSADERKKHCQDFLDKKKYPPGCEYCSFDKNHLIPRAKQI